MKKIPSKKPYPKAKAKINTEKNKEEILDVNIDKSKLKRIFAEEDKEGI